MNIVRRFMAYVVQTQGRHISVDTFARTRNEIFDKVREIRANADKIEPSKLFVVQLVKSSALRPYWEKDIVRILGLEESKHEKKMNMRKGVGTYVVVKNTPQMCRMLWRVKHLVRVKPVTFPDGLPTPGVYTNSYLNHSGEFRKHSNFEVDPERLVVNKKFERVKLEGREIAKPMHLRWMNSIS
ncbi:39S ribosomal protein L30, mitochondrial-like [Varroa jacobsoni]|uniref:Large ribosomal subunit protein uL30m n=1 Tax=Varroa destructor TaxID=109461 RepID=A0A7M7IYB8_VARDE|nr:39S ribosomal protein L30, mitochondrial-like [Varroa destructor]XP_022706041.1 39S ribosomal protein L30, mitochondrial-like [Varroa jacobsoni]